MSLKRRGILKLTAAGLIGLAGCTGASGPMTIKDTRVAHKDQKVGVFAELQDTSPGKAGAVTVHAELLDGQDKVIAEKKQEFDVGGRDKANVIVWFEDLSESDRGRVEGARAEVVS